MPLFWNWLYRFLLQIISGKSFSTFRMGLECFRKHWKYLKCSTTSHSMKKFTRLSVFHPLMFKTSGIFCFRKWSFLRLLKLNYNKEQYYLNLHALEILIYQSEKFF
jgi:hypothetical protein